MRSMRNYPDLPYIMIKTIISILNTPVPLDIENSGSERGTPAATYKKGQALIIPKLRKSALRCVYIQNQ